MVGRCVVCRGRFALPGSLSVTGPGVDRIRVGGIEEQPEGKILLVDKSRPQTTGAGERGLEPDGRGHSACHANRLTRQRMNILSRLGALFRARFQKRKLDAGMDEEMRSHVELRTEANIKAGMSPPDARRTALRQFGWTELIKEQCRDQRGVSWIENVFQDIRFGARQLRKNPGFTIVAALTLALGIGANTFVFSVLNQVYLQPLPFHEPARLVRIAILGKARDFQKLSFPEFLYVRDNSTTLNSVSAVQAAGMNLTGVDEPTSLQASLVSPGFFEALGIQPMIGRTFASSEYETGANHVVLLGYWVWQRNFSGARDVIDRVV